MTLSPLNRLVERLFGGYSRPLKSRKNYANISVFIFLWVCVLSKDVLRSMPAGVDLGMNVMFLLGWGALLVLAVRRRLLYLEKSSWWTLPIVAVSFGGTTCLAIFNRVPWWILPLVYFPPQISLITGRTEEPPRREVQHPRVRYALMVLALVDLPLAYGMQTDAQFWAYAVVCVPVMAYLTIDRFRDIGFSRWWSVPYTLIVLSPYFQFYLHPTVDRWFVALASIFLQTPAMFLRKGWHVRSNGSENS